MIPRVGEAIVLRTWPFLEADLLVSLFTRDQGRIKGVARHALRSRKRFGGALEPMTHVRATYAERPRQELVRLDAFEILSSPLSRPIDYARTAALHLLAEVLEEALPEQAAEDSVFRLALSILAELQTGRIWLPITYFCLWMNRLMGWMPELGHCVVCGQPLGRGAPIEGAAGMGGSSAPAVPRTAAAGPQTTAGSREPAAGRMSATGGPESATGAPAISGMGRSFERDSRPRTRSGQVWYSATSDGVTCHDDRRPGSTPLSAAAVETALRIFRGPIRDLAAEDWPSTRLPDLRRFAIETLERNLDHRLQSARALHRL
jgi:Recombination protein O N terminal/Recombination protein O C terminal